MDLSVLYSREGEFNCYGVVEYFVERRSMYIGSSGKRRPSDYNPSVATTLGALMVLTLKVISCAINYNDGMLKEENMRVAQKKNRLLKLPSIVEYVRYCLCCGSHFAGLVFEMKDYLEWTERRGIWTPSEKEKSPSPYWPTLRALFQAVLCMGLYIYLVSKFPTVSFYRPCITRMGSCETSGFPVHVWLNCTLQILFHMVNI